MTIGAIQIVAEHRAGVEEQRAELEKSFEERVFVDKSTVNKALGLAKQCAGQMIQVCFLFAPRWLGTKPNIYSSSSRTTSSEW